MTQRDDGNGSYDPLEYGMVNLTGRARSAAAPDGAVDAEDLLFAAADDEVGTGGGGDAFGEEDDDFTAASSAFADADEDQPGHGTPEADGGLPGLELDDGVGHSPQGALSTPGGEVLADGAERAADEPASDPFSGEGTDPITDESADPFAELPPDPTVDEPESAALAADDDDDDPLRSDFDFSASGVDLAPREVEARAVPEPAVEDDGFDEDDTAGQPESRAAPRRTPPPMPEEIVPGTIRPRDPSALAPVRRVAGRPTGRRSSAGAQQQPLSSLQLKVQRKMKARPARLTAWIVPTLFLSVCSALGVYFLLIAQSTVLSVVLFGLGVVGAAFGAVLFREGS